MAENKNIEIVEQFDENAYFMDNKIIYGRHATIVKKLKDAKIFKTNREAYILAPIIGFLYGIKSEEDKTPDESLGRPDETKVLAAELTREGDWKRLKHSYQLIILLDKEYTDDLNARIDKAFRNVLRDQEDKNLFESYIRGGIDKLNEKIFFNDALHEEEFMDNILEFVKDVKDTFSI